MPCLLPPSFVLPMSSMRHEIMAYLRRPGNTVSQYHTLTCSDSPTRQILRVPVKIHSPSTPASAPLRTSLLVGLFYKLPSQLRLGRQEAA